MNQVYQIAIDGPAGSGKSSIAKLIAKKLNFLFINTGGMFRCYAIALKDVDLTNDSLVKETLNKSKVELNGDRLYLNGKDVTDYANSAEIGLLASKVATLKSVRDKCLIEQRMIASSQSCVMEGRDTTSVVLPNATVRIFLTADPMVRAKRRWEQLNRSIPLEQIHKEVLERDYQDTHRALAPLICTKGCIKIDGTNETVESTANMIIDILNKEINHA